MTSVGCAVHGLDVARLSPVLAALTIVLFAGCADSTMPAAADQNGNASGSETMTAAPAEDAGASASEGAAGDEERAPLAGESAPADAGSVDEVVREAASFDAGETEAAVGRAPRDGGASVDASIGIDANPAGDPLNALSQCTSKSIWTTGTTQFMRPGEACPTCHSNFEIAGTVYPTGHEPDDCAGIDGGASNVAVIVTDATGQVFTLYPNQAGNFYTSITITPPFHAKVSANGKERAMGASQTNGACNSCHTQNGANGAPGRITLPD